MADNYRITVTLSGRDDLSDDLRNVNQNLQRFEGNARNADSASRQATGGFGALGGVVRGMAGMFGAMQIGRAVVDLNNLGTEVTSVRNTFQQLSGSPEAAARSLAEMREMTGGVVDDLTLMQGANSLLLTGLASTNEQAAELVDLGFRLSAAMGVDAKEGIENLNAALLNNSFARLDTLGISAAAVRERVNELKEAGMDMSEAFSQAVLEQGREKIELLGDAAANAETSFNRLGTRFTNFKQGLGEVTAGLVETSANLIELGFIAAEIGIGNVVDLAGGGTRSQQLYEDEIRQRQVGIMGTENPLITSGNVDIAGVQSFSDANPDTFRAISGGNVFQTMQREGVDAASALSGLSVDELLDAYRELAGFDFSNLPENDAWAMVIDSAVQAVDEYGRATAAAAQNQALFDAEVTRFTNNFEDARARQQAATEAANRAASEEQTIFEGLNTSYAALIGYADDFASIGGVSIMDPAEADEIIIRAESMEQRFEALQQLAEDTEFQYISEDELAWAEEMTNQATALADEAERAASAFEGMSLSEMFGQSGGGRFGELGDMVLSGVEDPEQRAALERQFNLASGRETDVSTAFEDEIVPLLTQITTDIGSDVGLAATERAMAALEEGTLAGLTGDELINSIVTAIGITQTASGQFAAVTPTSGADMMAMVNGDGAMGFAGFGMPTTTMTQPGGFDAPVVSLTGDMGGLGAPGGEGEGSSVEMMTEQTILLNDQIAVASEALGALVATDLTGVMDPFVHSFTTVEEAANVIQSQLDSMAGKTYTTTLRLQVLIDDPTGLGLGSNPAFASAVGVATANNGGSVPGGRGPE